MQVLVDRGWLLRPSALSVYCLAAWGVMLSLPGAPAAGDVPGEAPTPQTAWCWIAVDAADPVSPEIGAASTYLVNLAPPPPDANLTVSGTVALFTTNERYDIAFRDADVRRRAGADYAGTVLAVHFARPVRLEGAYVSALTAPVSQQCAPTAPLLPTVAYMRSVSPSAPEPSMVVDVSAPAPVQDPLPSCRVPYAKPKTVYIEPPQMRVTPNDERQLETWVSVRLAPSGNVISATTSKASGFSPYDDAVRRSAERATYAPAVFRCAAVSSEYKFVGVAAPD